ncbi:protein phosphatase [Nibricoccus aquaticus]|uniref:Protein phosphatase n=1 Tax=Nibricoccus aquaticus TaxID=2576891 RepID=A0A290Q8Q1_9BACT|nr:protein phosphatase 2C domain-containing protein [Nibricoccus aquaticus]ATC65029.1 protein phosphatase [Nibricoccus aquaticus]
MAQPSTPHAPVPRLNWSGLTDVGKVRTNNEDSFLGIAFDGHEVRYLGKIGESSMASTDFVFAVSDGMGGANSGEFASRIAVDKITRLLPKGFRLSAQGMSSGFPDLIGELFSAIHRDMIKMGQAYEECAGMGATLSLCWFTPEWMYFGHLGDSRVYYLPKNGPMTQVTHDHSQVGWMRRNGQLNEREARFHPRRNALQQALGAGHQFIDPHIGAVGYQTGDRFLICSDGLIDGLWDHRIEDLLRNPAEGQTPAQQLVTEAVAESGRDNTTAVVIEVR